MITPISFTMPPKINTINKHYTKFSFKGNIDSDKFESQQKNDPDIHISADIFDKKRKEELKNRVDFSLIEVPDENDSNYSEKLDLMAINFSITALKTIFDMSYEQIPSDMLDKIPTFLTTDVDNFIEALIKQTARLKDANISSITRFLKEEKYDEIKEMFRKNDLYSNYQKMLVLKAGQNRNPKQVIDLLTDNETIKTIPTINDKGDGTSAFVYSSQPGNMLVVTRDNNNGDYIDFATFPSITAGQFNKDGSIQNLKFVNQIDNSTTIIYPHDDKVFVVYNIGNSVAYKEFRVNDNGEYKLTDLKIGQEKRPE